MARMPVDTHPAPGWPRSWTAQWPWSVVGMMPAAPTDSVDDEPIVSNQTRPPRNDLSLDATLAELAEFVHSPTRLRILKRLQRSPCTTTELHDALDVHRTTLQRNLTHLREKQCIRSSTTETIYRLAPPGQLFLSVFQQIIPTTRTARRLGAFCAQFPGEMPVDVAYLRDCCLTTVESTPHAPQERLRTLLTTSETVRLSVVRVSPQQLRTMADQVASWATFDLISPGTVIEHLAATCPSLTETIVTTGGVHVLPETTSPSVGVGLLDETAVVIVYDNNQHIHALLEDTREQSPINEWVSDRFENDKRTATVMGE